MQQAMPLLGELPTEYRRLPDEKVALCSHWSEALWMCLDADRSRRTRQDLAVAAGIEPSTLSRYLHSKTSDRARKMSLDEAVAIEIATGTTVLEDYMRLRRQGLLNCQRSRSSRIEELERELAMLKSAG